VTSLCIFDELHSIETFGGNFSLQLKFLRSFYVYYLSMKESSFDNLEWWLDSVGIKASTCRVNEDKWISALLPTVME
jgi:hypothetical protein